MNEEMVRSPNSLEKVTNDAKTSTGMELYKKDDDVDDMDEEVILEDEKALSGNHIQDQFIAFVLFAINKRLVPTLSLLMLLW